MSVPIWLAVAMLVVAALPLVMTFVNLRHYRRSNADAPLDPERGVVGVCIPARNEEANIGDCVRSLLAQDDDRLRVYVYDDGSTDGTGGVLAGLCAQDERVRAVESAPLPEGWNGKQHACWRAARAAISDGCGWLLFCDADVRHEAGMLRRTRSAVGALSGWYERRGGPALGLVSTFPRQETCTIGEALQVPMMFYLLFGYLPMGRMRENPTDPAASASCGQFVFVRAACYEAVGGHEACKGSMHDGVMLPRAVRRAGWATDLFDGSDLVRVRMYRGFVEAWRGFAKNAYEGLGSLGLLVFLTLLHVFGHLGPWGALVVWASGDRRVVVGLVLLAAVLAPMVQRVVLAVRLRHTATGAVLHPFAVVLMVGVWWWSWVLQRSGRRSWRGRGEASGPVAG